MAHLVAKLAVQIELRPDPLWTRPGRTSPFSGIHSVDGELGRADPSARAAV
ncbi:hypothetical protein [Paenibacillus sp. NRS-1780]|uniref:hypothetical protein n=1 Tax=Paenibacillus sp. NRS-1780 TaxID=3233904 RepID=UPI003D27EEC8